jgi:hypothetical protein
MGASAAKADQQKSLLELNFLLLQTSIASCTISLLLLLPRIGLSPCVCGDYYT